MPEGYSKNVSVDEYKRGAYGPPTQHILRANLELALHEAIAAATAKGFGKSSQVAGWKTVLEASQRGDRIEVR